MFSKFFLPAFLLISLILAFFVYSSNLFEKNKVDPRVVLQTAAPANLKVLTTMQLAGGAFVDLYNPENRHKISILKVDNVEQPTISVANLVKKLDQARLGSNIPEITPLAKKYSLAQFNVMSADKLLDLKLVVGNKELEAQAFETTKEANYLVSIVNVKSNQYVFIFMHKSAAVDVTFAQNFLTNLPFFSAGSF